jgi:hypothetical protein
MVSRDYDNELRFPPFDFLRGPTDIEPHLFNHKALFDMLSRFEGCAAIATLAGAVEAGLASNTRPPQRGGKQCCWQSAQDNEMFEPPTNWCRSQRE